jgi:methyl-accepting chemotaxis protein-1 (serine sensor receptor)
MFNLTIRLRLIGTMGVMAIMLTIGGLMGIYGVHNSNTVIKELFTNQLPSVQALSEARLHLLRSRVVVDRAIAHPDSATLAATVARAEDF